jgi:hypothetical protein
MKMVLLVIPEKFIPAVLLRKLKEMSSLSAATTAAGWSITKDRIGQREGQLGVSSLIGPLNELENRGMADTEAPDA